MKLRNKTYLLFGFITIFSLCVTFIFLNQILLGRFIKLDEQAIKSDMANIIYALEDEMLNIKTNMINYSAWDDSYEFIKQANTAEVLDTDPYILESFPTATFTINHLHLVGLYNKNQELVYGRLYNNRVDTLTPIPKDLLNEIKSDNNAILRFDNPAGSKTGILMTEEGPMLTVSLPIVTSNLKGPVGGTMFIGRLLDTEENNRLNAITRSNIIFEKANLQQIPLLKNHNENQNNIWLNHISSNEVIVQSVVMDMLNKDGLLISSAKERKIYIEGKQAVRNYAIVIFLTILIISAVFILFNNRYILIRIDRLLFNIRSVTHKQDFSIRMLAVGRDEFAHLEREFNSMMASLETAHNHLFVQANLDPLTGVYNRTFFNNQLDIVIAKSEPLNNWIGVLFIDIDNFKNINDTWSHDAGDALLIEVATRLKQCMDSQDVVSRLGGDEFTILLANYTNESEILLRTEQIFNALSKTYHINDFIVNSTFSTGISIYPNNGIHSDVLVTRADLAMFKAKKSGGNQISLYSDKLEAEFERSRLLKRYLDKAILNNELSLYYQPIIDAKSLITVRVEALLRWSHPLLGTIPPSEFIPLAEESESIIEIGMWVIRQACSDLKLLQAKYKEQFQMAINLSVIQLEHEQFLDKFNEILQVTGIHPSYIQMEITESTIMKQGTAFHTLQKLYDYGVKISIDDFGTGYSSLSYLRNYPVHMIKVDQSFVTEITNTNQDSTICKAIIDLGHNLGLQVLVEGVETEEQMILLQRLQCDEIQGYFISFPLTFEDLIEFLTSQEATISINE